MISPRRKPTNSWRIPSISWAKGIAKSWKHSGSPISTRALCLSAQYSCSLALGSSTGSISIISSGGRPYCKESLRRPASICSPWWTWRFCSSLRDSYCSTTSSGTIGQLSQSSSSASELCSCSYPRIESWITSTSRSSMLLPRATLS